MIGNKVYIILVTASVLFCACKDKAVDDEFVGYQNADKIRNDSLFFGICFGMKDLDFYNHCFQMNQQGLFRQSVDGVQVQCILREGFGGDVVFSFFPTFRNSRIESVKGTYQYRAWAPFQPKYAASKLLKELIEVFESDYGGRSFELMENQSSQFLGSYSKIDSNRKIVLQESMDGRLVEVLFEDLRP